SPGFVMFGLRTLRTPGGPVGHLLTGTGDVSPKFQVNKRLTVVPMCAAANGMAACTYPVFAPFADRQYRGFATQH
ncbi:MAG TPA: hypothetical protein VGC74_15820, partial [Stenotrophomonas sp.]